MKAHISTTFNNSVIKIALGFGMLLMFVFIFNKCVPDILCVNGSGVLKKEIRITEKFTKISFETTGTIYIRQSDTLSLTVEAQDNILKILKTEVSGEILKIYFDHCVRDDDGINIYLTTPVMDGLKVTGSGEIIAQTAINTPNMDLKVSGSGKIVIDTLNAQYVDTHISGSGNIFIKSKNDNLHHKIRITGSGSINAYDFVSNDVVVEIESSGSCKINVLDNLDVSINGSGAVYYLGNPLIKQQITGSGKIIKATP